MYGIRDKKTGRLLTILAATEIEAPEHPASSGIVRYRTILRVGTFLRDPVFAVLSEAIAIRLVAEGESTEMPESRAAFEGNLFRLSARPGEADLEVVDLGGHGVPARAGR